jgi:polyisoprenyl-phosphate glycosyltransferase
MNPNVQERDSAVRTGGQEGGQAVPELSVVVPVYNEEANIEQLYRRVVTALDEAGISFELIFVDDGSVDRSLSIMKRLAGADERVRYASFSRNFGHEAASTCGMRMVRGLAAVLMDADLQDPPEIIPRMHASWKEGFDVVCARRSSRAGESLMKKVTSHYFYRFMNRFSAVKLPVDVGDFRLADRKVVDAFNRLPEHSRFVRGLFCWVGYRQTEIEYERQSRAEGKTKYNWVRLFLLSLDAFFGFSLVPLRLCILLGVIVIVFSFVIACIIIAQRLFFSLAIPGYALMTTGMFFLGGVQLTFLGVIGEYVGKIFTQVQGRPLYIVNETSGQD